LTTTSTSCCYLCRFKNCTGDDISIRPTQTALFYDRQYKTPYAFWSVLLTTFSIASWCKNVASTSAT